MVIHSPFKDYYDWVAGKYGGGDPKIVYARVALGERDPTVHFILPRQISFPITTPPPRLESNSCFRCKWLAIAGKYYLLVKEISIYANINVPTSEKPWSLFVEGKHPKLDEALLPQKGENNWRKNDYGYYVGRPSEEVIRISKEIHAPVFCLSEWGNFVEGIVPNLGELGIPAIVSAEQMYQDLSYFMGNVINESPDIQPAGKPPQTDREKVVSHGFDLKTSFRHRKV